MHMLLCDRATAIKVFSTSVCTLNRFSPHAPNVKLPFNSVFTPTPLVSAIHLSSMKSNQSRLTCWYH